MKKLKLLGSSDVIDIRYFRFFTQNTVQEIDTLVRYLHPIICMLTDLLTCGTAQERSATVDQGCQDG